jgi:hypothetical protein
MLSRSAEVVKLPVKRVTGQFENQTNPLSRETWCCFRTAADTPRSTLAACAGVYCPVSVKIAGFVTPVAVALMLYVPGDGGSV